MTLLRRLGSADDRDMTVSANKPPTLQDMIGPVVHGIGDGLVMGWPLVVLIAVGAVLRIAAQRRRTGA
jgi:hypothetical protein